MLQEYDYRPAPFWFLNHKLEKEELKPVQSPEGLEDIEINAPVEPVIIEKVTVDTFGIQYPEPVKLDIMPETGGWK